MKTPIIAALMLGTAVFPVAASAQQAATPPADAASASAPSSAPTPGAALAVGGAVYGPTGEEVGTVEAITGDAVVLNTGTAKATLAKASFGTSAKGVTIGMTKAQLEAAVQQAQAQASATLDSKLTPGTAVRSKDGQPIGKIASISGDSVVLDRTEGPVTLKKEMFTADQQGVMLGLTAAEFASAAHAATAAAPKTAG